MIDLLIGGDGSLCCVHILPDQRLRGIFDGAFDQRAHFQQMIIQLFQLLVESISHAASSLAKSSRNIVLSSLVLWDGEQLLRFIVFDHFTQQEESGSVRNAHRLLHVVRDHDDRVLLPERERKILDLRCGDGIKRKSFATGC